MDANDDSVDAFLPAPLETVREHLVAPDMLTAEAFHDVEIVDLMVFNDVGPKFETQNFARRKERRDFIESILRR